LALALTLPLALYGIPYAYAATTQSTYIVLKEVSLLSGPGVLTFTDVQCLNPSDFTLHYTAISTDRGSVVGAEWLDSTGNIALTANNPNGWRIWANNPTAGRIPMNEEIACQSPITVAGIGVPEFGSLYVAIALGAVVYFMLSRRLARGSTLSAHA